LSVDGLLWVKGRMLLYADASVGVSDRKYPFSWFNIKTVDGCRHNHSCVWPPFVAERKAPAVQVQFNGKIFHFQRAFSHGFLLSVLLVVRADAKMVAKTGRSVKIDKDLIGDKITICLTNKT